MILTSPSEDAGQSPPVTTTFDPPAHTPGTAASRRRGTRVDWDRVERLYSFVRARALERLQQAEQSGDGSAWGQQRESIHALDAMFTQAQRRRGVVAACAITFFRARAMRDAQHPEFLGEWIGRPRKSQLGLVRTVGDDEG